MSKRSDASITIVLKPAELAQWEALAKRQGLTLEQLAKESVELAYARGSTR